MATRVNIVSVDVLNNPSTFASLFELEITFEVFEYLPHGMFLSLFTIHSSADLEWSLVYVGSAETHSHDQLLDSVLVGPINEGRHKFVFQVS